MEVPFLSFNIRMMNLILGMCKGTVGLPRVLKQLGYKDKWIEFNFTNSRGEAVVPELIVASEQTSHTMLFEWKSGPNADADQLHRYAHVTGDDLRQKAFLVENEVRAHDTVLVGEEEHVDGLTRAIENGRHGFPLLVTSANGLMKVRNRFAADQLDRFFNPTVEVDWNTVPTFLFPLDTDSALGDFAQLMMPAILERMAKGETRILLDQIPQDIIPAWSNLVAAYQNRLKQKMLQVMERATNHEFSGYLRRNRPAEARTHTPTWDITENPISNTADRRMPSWKQIQKQARSLVDFFSPGLVQPDLPFGEEQGQ